MKPLNSHLGKAIREARKKADMTQGELASVCHVTSQAVSNWERGKNDPSEDLIETLEKALKTKLRRPMMEMPSHNSFATDMPTIKELKDINVIDELLALVSDLVDTIIIDSYCHTVKKMLYFTLIELLGYDIYYLGHGRHYFDEYPLEWADIADNINSLLDDSDPWILEKMMPNLHHFYASTKNITRKVNAMSFQIGGDLFEDFDEELGYRKNFEQQIGNYGKECGNKLAKLLPSFNSDLMIVYKNALMDLIDLLEKS